MLSHWWKVNLVKTDVQVQVREWRVIQMYAGRREEGNQQLTLPPPRHHTTTAPKDTIEPSPPPQQLRCTNEIRTGHHQTSTLSHVSIHHYDHSSSPFIPLRFCFTFIFTLLHIVLSAHQKTGCQRSTSMTNPPKGHLNSPFRSNFLISVTQTANSGASTP